MRRRISFLLSLIMFISMININPTYIMAAENINLSYLSQIGLRETEAGMVEKDISKDAEEATLEWSIEGGSGKYKLEYYTDSIKDNPDDTTKVSLGFEVGKDKDDKELPNKVKVTAELFKSDGTPIEASSYQNLFPYTGQYSDVTTGSCYTSELTIPVTTEPVATAAKELSLHIGKNLQLRIMTDGKAIKVWTNQINKGYVTDFTLYYEGSEQDSTIVFPGLKDASISSIYLEETGGLVDREKPIDASKGEQAGDRPGIKVEIERPWVRDTTTNKYKQIESDQAKTIKMALNLFTKLEPDNTVAANQIQLKFDLAANEKLQGEILGGADKYANIVGENICIYVAKSKTYTNADNQKYVVEWPALEESMVIGGELTLNGSVTIAGTTHSISTGNVALATGYTYLKFTPEQSNVGEVTLQITPYKYKGEITYQVYVANATDSATSGAITDNALLGEYKFTYDPTFPDRKLEISVPSGVESIFLVKADLANDASDATSQEVYYNSQSDSVVVRPYTPYIREVNSIYVIPENETGVEAAGMNVIWNAPTKEKLAEILKDDKKLYFELFLQDSNKENKAVIAIFEARLEGTEVKVEQVGRSHANVKHDLENNQFIAENVVLKDLEKTYWEKITLPDRYESGTDYPEITESSYAEDMSYQIPKSFYLSMRSVLDTTTSSSLKVSANESQLYPITLDGTSQSVSSPSGVSIIKKQDTTEIEMNFNDVNLESFVDYVLSPAKWYLLGSDENKTFPGEYEIALYQANYLDEANKINSNEISDGVLTSYIDEQNSKIYNWQTSLTTTPAALNLAENTEALNALRSGKVLMITLDKEDIKNGDLNSINIKGLDPNQAYYVRVRVKLESERIKYGNKEERTDYSLFSKIVGFTSNTVVKPIEPEEEVPPTPKEYTAAAKSNSTAVLNWKDPDIAVQSSDSLTYEIIRTKEQKISDSLLNRDTKASDIISQETGKGATLFGSANYKLIDTEDGAVYELVDETLQPNTVYYYYIRTVYNGIYSDWIYQPVTTANIDEPISLKAFNATKTTVDISFLAKVPSSALYGTYDFGIAIQGEDNKWNTVLASELTKITGEASTSVEEGYTYYAYRIPDLTPGKRYNIKVCVIDKTKEKIDNKYQQSLYSNIVYIRTEYDQEEQDKEDKYTEYLDRFDKEVEKFRNQAYWVVEEDTTYKYREEYLESELGMNKEYTLVTDSNSSQATYYFPITLLSKVNDEQTNLKIVLGDETIYIRPNTIKSDNSLLTEADDLIKANKLDDYYWKVSVSKNKYSGTINNEEVISPKISLDMDLVYMKQEDIETEADILEALESIIKTKREAFIDKLEKKLDSGKLADDVLQSILDDVLSDVEEQHIKKVDKIMDKQIKKTISVGEISQAILIIHSSENAAVNGYYYANNWTQVETLATGNGFAIEAIKLGTYIFTGQKPLIDTVPEVAPYQSFINKYQLTEFFKMDSYMLQTAVTKQQVYGALARMLGASKGTDYATYLESKGIKGVSKLTGNNTIRQDEAIYIIMQGYELIKHKKVDTIVIKNRQSVQNIGAFQPVYRQYVYAAVELKVTVPQDSRVLPSKQMTGTEIIAMLYKIQ